jgi:hypothetical protein
MFAGRPEQASARRTGDKAIRDNKADGWRRCCLFRDTSPFRDSFGDSRDVAIETSADLAKTGKSQVAFPAFHSAKITPVNSTQLRKFFLVPT